MSSNFADFSVYCVLEPYDLSQIYTDLVKMLVQVHLVVYCS